MYISHLSILEAKYYCQTSQPIKYNVIFLIQSQMMYNKMFINTVTDINEM